MTHPRRRSPFPNTAAERASLTAEVATALPACTADALGLPALCGKRICRRSRRCHADDVGTGLPLCFKTVDSASRTIIDTLLAEARRTNDRGDVSFELEMALYSGNEMRIAAAEVVRLAHPPGDWQKLFAAREERAARKLIAERPKR